eukprot:TRINITY_DN496_c1_g1_i1.p1 TRINITY_DN496_c1_g1~~TRINITY_DN496_c1_g1_i1.p1  ORF type:complete len:123 (+),score=39.37 TRINITY_DN496_c1_g1_i1:67-435(+)
MLCACLRCHALIGTYVLRALLLCAELIADCPVLCAALLLLLCLRVLLVESRIRTKKESKVKRDTVVLLVESRVRMEKESKVKKARHNNNRERPKKRKKEKPTKETTKKRQRKEQVNNYSSAN